MNAFDQIAAMPGLRSLVDIAWRVFGVNPALVSPDGKGAVVFEPETRSQPFCAALQRDTAGRTLCAMCDESRFLEARRGSLTLRYRCHAAGQTEAVAVQRVGPDLVFGRLWEELHLGAILHRALEGRRYEFDVERAILPDSGPSLVRLGQ